MLKKIGIFALSLIFACGIVFAQQTKSGAGVESGDDIQPIEMNKFSWKVAVLQRNEDVAYAKSVVNQIEFKNDDQEYQLYIEADQVAFCYILDETPEGLMFEMFSTALKPNRPVYLPDAAEWYTMPLPHGTEKIHILISSRPLTFFKHSLDTLARSNNSFSESRTLRESITRMKKFQERQEIGVSSGEIQSAKKVTYQVAGEKATKFSGMGIYVQTITIKH